ncbi:hypothetical protein TKK_0004049 [Trichogramma kaykai]|uniref:Protein SERAC1 n=1 Tax=Trichogramma kaykai TaxID=54128 RepID=A0ABD2XP41_9HYME
MLLSNYKRTVHYLKSSGACVIVLSGCWLLYQIKKSTSLFRSILPTKILNLENTQAHYIYIDDPRFQDISMFNHFDDLQKYVQEKPKNISYIVTKWWKYLNRQFAHRLFHLAKTGDKFEKLKALNSLVSMKHLKDWHYNTFAQQLDAQTAVALARTPQADLRFFLRPPYSFEKNSVYDIVESLHDLLKKLNALCAGCHPCLLQFLHKKFQNLNRDSSFEFDLSSSETPIVWDKNFIFNCIQALHHHSSLEDHSKDVADAGGLKILMNIYKLVGNDIEICAFIAKILSNLSLFPEYLEDIFKSGWIGVLAAWSRNEDIRLASPASRALINLDFNDIEDVRFPQRIYPLYPLHRTPYKKNLDVIFIHGLLGGVFVTWRQRDLSALVPVPKSKIKTDVLSVRNIVQDYPSEFLKDLARDMEKRDWQRVGHDFEVILSDCPVNVRNAASGPFFCKGDDRCMQQSEKDASRHTPCWPKDWIPDDVPNVRVLGLNYTSNLSMWTPLCPIEGVRSTIKDRSSEFTRKLLVAGVGQRSIIWACHSMGGLLVKKMLVEEWKNGDKSNLVRNTKGIVFYSTPHQGSHVASLNQTTQMLVWPSVEVQELREQSPQLLELQNDFLNMLKEHEIEIISFGETKPTRVTALKVPFIFVNPASADPGVGEFFEIPQDHLSICKPANRQSFLYQKVLSMIKRHVTQDTNQKDQCWKNLFSFAGRVL